MIDSSALSGVPLAERRGVAGVAPDHASRLHFPVLAESLKQAGFCIVQAGVAHYRLLPRAGSTQLPRVSEDGT